METYERNECDQTWDVEIFQGHITGIHQKQGSILRHWRRVVCLCVFSCLSSVYVCLDIPPT